MPETAGTTIQIDCTSAEFVHFTHTIYLSCVKYNSIPYSRSISHTTTYGTIQGPILKDISRISHTVSGFEGYDMDQPHSPRCLLLGFVAPCLQVSCGSKPVGYEIKSVLSRTCGCTYSMPGETHNEPVLIRLGQTLLSTCTK